jgi:hypothetical protein
MAGLTSGDPDGETAAEPPEPRGLRALRRLVTLLTATLILGVITIVVLLVIRLWALAPTPAPALPAEIALPAGETARAVTLGTGWVAVVTVDAAGAERIRVLDAATGAERGVLAIPGPVAAPN